jgi:PIN domain nuclease of toxin-antitoxin system
MRTIQIQMPISDSVLLDTNAAIYLVEGLPIRPDAEEAMRRAVRARALMVSPITGWEIGTLIRKGRMTHASFAANPRLWFQTLLAGHGIGLAPFTLDMALDCHDLPGHFHDDPADRMLVATARNLGIPLMTRDRKIIAYARAGHVQVIPC